MKVLCNVSADKPKLKMGHTLYSGYADNLHGPSLNMRLQHILWLFSEKGSDCYFYVFRCAHADSDV